MDIKQNKSALDKLEMIETLKVPQSRIGVIIGKKGSTKSLLEEKTQTKITIKSKEGMVTIVPAEKIEDPTYVWVARDIVKAIGRGFSEKKAFKLLDPDYYLDILLLEHENKSRLNQIRGRVIGEGGKTRTIIEQSTRTYLSIQGKTIAIIGLLEEVPIAKKCVEMLLDGNRHATVYRFLEKHRIKRKREDLEIWQKKLEFRNDI